MAFDLENYETVKERKKKFYKDYTDGRIIVEPQHIDENSAVFKAIVYKNATDQERGLPFAVGFAQEFKGQGSFANKNSWSENCEESAIGRALDNAGYSGNGKCSQEEMAKVERNEKQEKPATVKKLERKKL